jgi:hypothetical protein
VRIGDWVVAGDWRDDRIAELEGALAARDARIVQLEAQVAALTKQVAELLEIVGRCRARGGSGSLPSLFERDVAGAA